MDERPVIEDSGAPRWNLKRANWELFTSHLDDLPDQLETGKSTQQTYARLVDAINEAAEASIPKQKMTTKHRPLPYWSEACTTAVKLRNAARHRAHRHRFREDAAEHQAEYVRLKGEAQRTI